MNSTNSQRSLAQEAGYTKNAHQMHLSFSEYRPDSSHNVFTQLTNVGAIKIAALNANIKEYEELLKKDTLNPSLLHDYMSNWILRVLDCFPDVWDQIIVVGDENLTLRQHIFAYLKGLIIHSSDADNLPQSLPRVESVLAGLFHDIGKPLSVARQFHSDKLVHGDVDHLGDRRSEIWTHKGDLNFCGIQYDKGLRTALRAELKAGEKIETRRVLLALKSNGLEAMLGHSFLDLALGLGEAGEDIDVDGSPICNATLFTGPEDPQIAIVAEDVRELARTAGYNPEINSELTEFFSYLVRHYASDSSAYAPGVADYPKIADRYGYPDTHPSRMKGLAEFNCFTRLFGNWGEHVTKPFEGAVNMGNEKSQNGIRLLREALGITEYVDDIIYVKKIQVENLLPEEKV